MLVFVRLTLAGVSCSSRFSLCVVVLVVLRVSVCRCVHFWRRHESPIQLDAVASAAGLPKDGSFRAPRGLSTGASPRGAEGAGCERRRPGAALPCPTGICRRRLAECSRRAEATERRVSATLYGHQPSVASSLHCAFLQFVPGPGAYEVPDQWPVRDVTATPTAAFLSRTMRAPFSPARRVASASPTSPARQAKCANGSGDQVVRPHTAAAELQRPTKPSKSPRSRLRLPKASGRLDLPLQLPDPHVELYARELTYVRSFSSINPLKAAAFPKVRQEPESFQGELPAVGSYDIQRLWDSSGRRTTMGAPSPAPFGASRARRAVTWRPALTPASFTVSTSWDSSRHYAKVKDQVVRSAAKRRLHSAKLHARSTSSPTLRPATASNASHAEVGSTDTPEDDHDPFSWLRQRPNGEHRVNVLAAKHGLVHHIKAPTRRSTENRNASASHGEEQPTPGSPAPRLERQHSNLQDDCDVADTEPQYTTKAKDVRIKVSCRMPGGMLITTSVYSMKMLGHFKSAILVRQKRFQTAEQFDLYHTSGRKLTGLENALVACGVRDRSMLQIVPSVGTALSPNPAPSDTTLPLRPVGSN
jgi:hypothetical protein